MLKEINKLFFETTTRTRALCIGGLIIFSPYILPSFIEIIFSYKKAVEEISTMKGFIPVFELSFYVFCLPAYLICVFSTFKPGFFKGRLLIGLYVIFCVLS